MKKMFSIVLSIIFLLSVFSSCSSSKADDTEPTGKPTEAAPEISPTNVPEQNNVTNETESSSSDDKTTEAAALKTGIGIIATVTGNSRNASGAQNGIAQTEATIAAVLVDDNGVIQDCDIDMAYTNIEFTSQGAVITDTCELCPSKTDLGTAYGMGANSPIGKEWFEQTAAFADYVVGKTLDEVMGIAIDPSSGKATDVDLVSSVTFRVSDIHKAVIEAVNNAQYIGAAEGDRLGLGIATSLGPDTKNADGQEGNAQAMYSYTAISFDTAGKVTGNLIGAIPADVCFSKDGVISTASGVELKTKTEMVDASSDNKEWCNQVIALSGYMIGKTIEEIQSINADGYVSDMATELKGTVTIPVGDILQAVKQSGRFLN